MGLVIPTQACPSVFARSAGECAMVQRPSWEQHFRRSPPSVGQQEHRSLPRVSLGEIILNSVESVGCWGHGGESWALQLDVASNLTYLSESISIIE